MINLYVRAVACVRLCNKPVMGWYPGLYLFGVMDGRRSAGHRPPKIKMTFHVEFVLNSTRLNNVPQVGGASDRSDNGNNQTDAIPTMYE